MKEIKRVLISNKTYAKLEKLAKENNTTKDYIVSSIIEGAIDEVVIAEYPQT